MFNIMDNLKISEEEITWSEMGQQYEEVDSFYMKFSLPSFRSLL